MGKKEIRARTFEVRIMMMVTHCDKKSQRPARRVTQALRSGVSIAIGKSFGRLEALRMAARKFEPEERDLDEATTSQI